MYVFPPLIFSAGLFAVLILFCFFQLFFSSFSIFSLFFLSKACVWVLSFTKCYKQFIKCQAFDHNVRIVSLFRSVVAVPLWSMCARMNTSCTTTFSLSQHPNSSKQHSTDGKRVYLTQRGHCLEPHRQIIPVCIRQKHSESTMTCVKSLILKICITLLPVLRLAFEF